MVAKAMITFVGGPGDGDTGVNIWPYGAAGHDLAYRFERNVPLLVENDHIIKKAESNRFFKVKRISDEEAEREKAKATAPAEEPEDHGKRLSRSSKG